MEYGSKKLLFNHTNDGTKGMAAHFSILAWRIPWTEEPGGLQSMGSWRVRHDWTTNTLTFIQMLYCALGLLRKSWAIWIWTSQMIQVEAADGFFSSAKVEWSAAMATVKSSPGNTFAGSPLPRGGDTVYCHRSHLCTDSLAQWFSSCACVGLRWGQEVSCISLHLTPLQAAATAGTTLWEPLLQPERWCSWVKKKKKLQNPPLLKQNEDRFSFHLDESVALMNSLFVIQKAVLKKTSPEIHPVNLHCATSTETIHTRRFDSGLVLYLSSSEHSMGIQKAVLWHGLIVPLPSPTVSYSLSTGKESNHCLLFPLSHKLQKELSQQFLAPWPMLTTVWPPKMWVRSCQNAKAWWL